MFHNQRSFVPRWLTSLWTKKKTTLVQHRSDQSLAVFQPMIGNGTFGATHWGAWSRQTNGSLNCDALGAPLVTDELQRLAALMTTHYGWWTPVPGGAFLVVRSYPAGITSTSITVPSTTDGGGSRV